MEIHEISKSPKDVKKGVVCFQSSTLNHWANTLVLNHFHSVKSILFLSARQRNFDGMLGTGLPVSMYTMKPSFLNAKLGYQNPKN